jgi:Protein of unknown function (DUF2721)
MDSRSTAWILHDHIDSQRAYYLPPIRMLHGGYAHGFFHFTLDPVQLSHVISEATAPAFVLGAVAGFVSILLGQLTSVVERIRYLNDIGDGEQSRAELKSDVPRLRLRARMLIQATRLALAQLPFVSG